MHTVDLIKSYTLSHSVCLWKSQHVNRLSPSLAGEIATALSSITLAFSFSFMQFKIKNSRIY